MKVCIVIGTRPEIIKLSPIIRICESEKIDYFIIHTGQHFSANMDKIFFEELELPQPKYNLELGNRTYEAFQAGLNSDIGPVLKQEKPDIVLVQGDTTTVLGGALSASKHGIKIGHVEAGLRSRDYRMMEEFNRIVTDNLSDFLFCPTEETAQNPRSEGINPNKIFVTGNTIVDSVYQSKRISDAKSKILEKLNLLPKSYCLITMHRAENVDIKENLQDILFGLSLVAEKNPDMRFILPLHPRTKKRMEEFGLAFHKRIEIIEPQGYVDFMKLESNAKIIMTDSGGIQEEAFILEIPCVTLRISTERPETVVGGGNLVAGYSPENILKAFTEMKSKKIKYNGVFGKGDTSRQIIDILKKEKSWR